MPQQNNKEMKYTQPNIDNEALTFFTGDQFIDAGGFVLKELFARYPNANILDLIMLATNIYIDKWDSKLNTFFLNSKITQPSFKADQKKEETRKYFEGLLNETLPYIIGYCQVTNKKTKLFPACRDNSVLSGSRTFVNFHHTFQNGIMLSKEALIRYHFLPLGCEILQGKIAVIHSNNPQISELYARNCCSRNLTSIGQNFSDGVLRNRSKAIGTALFRYIDDIINKYIDDETQNTSLTLYHFTNFGASPEIHIYTLPFMTFDFYSDTQKAIYKQDWNKFIAHHYYSPEIKNAKYIEKSNLFITIEKTVEKQITEEQFKYWKNNIYEKLLVSKSIIPDIRKWSENHHFNLNLLKRYLIKVRNMKKETIVIIDQIANAIIKHTKDTEMNKVITTLNGAKSSFLLRRFILKVVDNHYKQNNEQSLITVEDYVEYLFPDSRSWTEIRDVLLIAIYQKLHELNLHVNIELTDNDIFPNDED